MALSSHFPLQTLDPETFERFVEAVVAARYPDADVNILGSRGHDQKGSDILAVFPRGERWSFQCKRVERFGPADIAKAVAHHTLDAERRFIVLSKIATPAAIQEAARHEGWTLWDKQVLTRVVRELPIEAQTRLVDIFFNGQRMALLGKSEPGPWLTTEEYYQPFSSRAAIFSHDWELVGRKAEIDSLVDALRADVGGDLADGRVTLLIGAGGIGKTRVMKEAVKRFAREAGRTTIRFLSLAQEATAANLSDLGSGPKLLIVDDAHDREGLKLFLEYVVDARNDARLLIASRPYAERRIMNELGLYRIVDPKMVRLGRLDRKSLRSLAVEVLSEFGGDGAMADAVVDVASDSPLVAAMAAKVAAAERRLPMLASGSEELRRFILSRFAGVITGELGGSADMPALRAVLEVLALIQPFHIDDRRLTKLVQIRLPSISAADVTRALKLLLDGAVIYQRGALHRLMPEMLGDFLIEDSCIGADGRLTKFALDLVHAVESDRLTEVLVNLGRTEWRLADGDTSNRTLLMPIWQHLDAIDKEYDSRIAAIEAVAYYQPAQALSFVQRQINRGRTWHEFGNILQRVAYTLENRGEALRLLWDLGLLDERELNSHPDHPIRILADLIGYDRHKPVAFNEEVAEFAFGLLENPLAWSGKYTPLDILRPLLSGEGTTTRSTGRGIALSPFLVSYDVVAPLRNRLVSRICDLLESPDASIALRSGKMVAEAVRRPYGLMGQSVPEDLTAKYEAEFARSLARIDHLLGKGTLASTTVIGLIRSLDWSVNYGPDPIREQVQGIFAKIPCDLGFRLQAAVAEDADWAFTGQVPFEEWDEDKDWRGGFLEELVATYPEPQALCDALVNALEAAEAAGMTVSGASPLISRLAREHPTIATEIIQRSLINPSNRLCSYLGYAVGALVRRQPVQGRAIVRQILVEHDAAIRIGGAEGVIFLPTPLGQDDLALLEEVLASHELAIATVGISALRGRTDISPHQMMSLLLSVDIERNPILLEGVATVACSRSSALLDKSSEEDARELLCRVARLSKIEGHWTRELIVGLGKRFGLLVAEFVIERASRGMAANDEGGAEECYEVLPYWGRHNGLGLDKSSQADAILGRVWSWLRDHDDVSQAVRYSLGETVAAMFDMSGTPVTCFLETLVDRATAEDLRWIAYVLRNSHNRFVLDHPRLVELYLARCKSVDQELFDFAIEKLMTSAMSGGWSGSVGEPMPRDVRSRDDTRRILSTMSRLAPAYALYRPILDWSETNIAKSLREGRELDEQED